MSESAAAYEAAKQIIATDAAALSHPAVRQMALQLLARIDDLKGSRETRPAPDEIRDVLSAPVLMRVIAVAAVVEELAGSAESPIRDACCDVLSIADARAKEWVACEFCKHEHGEETCRFKYTVTVRTGGVVQGCPSHEETRTCLCVKRIERELRDEEAAASARRSARPSGRGVVNV